MSEKRHELYLIAFALVSSAVLILYIAFDSPQLNAMEIQLNSNVVLTYPQANLQEGDLSPTRQLEADPIFQSAENEVYTQGTQVDEVAVKPQTPAATPKYSGPVNINTASKEQLMTLNGIGEVKAAAILEYRRENGNFYTVDELINVKGIGEKTLEKIRANVRI